MRIGLISDTHGYLPPKVFKLFDGVDLILHAGDIGKEEVIIELSTIAEVRAVCGNTDHYPLISHFNQIEFFELEGIKICLTHIVNSPKSFAFELFKMNKKVDVVVFGHTHKAAQIKFEQILFINPGSASQPRYSKAASVAVLKIEEKKLNVELKYF